MRVGECGETKYVASQFARSFANPPPPRPPVLTGSGSLVGGQPVTLALTSAKPATLTTLVLGLSLLNAPFKGGTLVPNPNILFFGLPTNGHGNLTLNATWPSGLPSGLAVITQFWIPDPAGPAGFAASNGLAGTTP